MGSVRSERFSLESSVGRLEIARERCASLIRGANGVSRIALKSGGRISGRASSRGLPDAQIHGFRLVSAAVAAVGVEVDA